jgi:hypothetical protein
MFLVMRCGMRFLSTSGFGNGGDHEARSVAERIQRGLHISMPYVLCKLK